MNAAAKTASAEKDAAEKATKDAQDKQDLLLCFSGAATEAEAAAAAAAAAAKAAATAATAATATAMVPHGGDGIEAMKRAAVMPVVGQQIGQQKMCNVVRKWLPKLTLLELQSLQQVME
jgi:hypothetical protein